MSPALCGKQTFIWYSDSGQTIGCRIKAEDVKDATVKGAKTAGEKTKDVGAEVGDKAEDVKDTTVKGTKVAAEKTKAVSADVADKGEDVGKKTAKGAKSAGNWFTRAFKKIF